MPNILMLDKNNEEFDVAPEHFEAAIGKGLEPAFEMKDKGGETQVVRKRDYETARKKGLVMSHEFDIANKPVETPSLGETAAMGGASALGLSLQDEMYGASRSPMGAAKTIANKFGADFDDTDTAIYKNMRDDYRKREDKAWQENPKSYAAGYIPGMVGQAVLGGGSALAGKFGVNVGQGALYGLGGSESEDLKGNLKDMALGAGTSGALGYAAPKVLGAATKGVKAGIDTAKTIFDDGLFNVSGRAAKQAIEDTANQPGILRAATVPIETAKNIVKTSVREAESGRELNKLSAMAKDMFVDGNLNNEEAIALALQQKGMNPVKQYLLEKASMQSGRYEYDDLQRALNLSADEMNDALNFDKSDYAREMLEGISGIRKKIRSDAGDTFGDLRQKAMGELEKKNVFGVNETLESAIQDTTKSREITSKTKNTLEDVKDIIFSGRGMSDEGLEEGVGLGVSKSEEMYKRLHAARKRLDAAIDRKNMNDPNNRILFRVRADIDERIKTAPSQVKADKVYSGSKNIVDKFFKGITDKDGQVNTQKIKNLFGNNARNEDARLAIPQLKEYLEQNRNHFSNVDDSIKILSDIQKKIEMGDNAAAIGRAIGNPSGTGAKVKMMQGKKTDYLSDLINFPVENMQGVAQARKLYSERYLGKKASELTRKEEEAIAKAFNWDRINKDVTPQEREKMLKSILGVK